VSRRAAAARPFLIAGLALAPLFYLVVFVQLFARAGFDLHRHAISSLSLGQAGWVQVTSFIVTGVLGVLLAIGLRRSWRGGRGGVAAPVLITLYGVGIILAGLFPPDPALGFPPGAPDSLPATMSQSAQLHSVGFFTAFTALTVACFVGARRFFGDRRPGWGWYAVASGLIAPALVAVGSSGLAPSPGVCFALAGLVGFGWMSVVAGRLLADLTAPHPLGRIGP